MSDDNVSLASMINKVSLYKYTNNRQRTYTHDIKRRLRSVGMTPMPIHSFDFGLQ